MTDLGGVVGGLLNPVGQIAGQTLGDISHAASYVVQPGDTLGSIAADQGVSLGSLLDANPQVLHADLVQPGDQLTIPSAESEAALEADAPTDPDEAGDLEVGSPVLPDPSADLGVVSDPLAGLGVAAQLPDEGSGSVDLSDASFAGPPGSPASALDADPVNPALWALLETPGSSPNGVAGPVLDDAQPAATAPLPMDAQAIAPDQTATAALLAATSPLAAEGAALAQLASPGIALVATGPPLMQAIVSLDPELAQLLAFTQSGGVRPMALAAIAERLALPLPSLTGAVETAAYLALAGREEAAVGGATVLEEAPGRVLATAPQASPPGIDLPASRRVVEQAFSRRADKQSQGRNSRAAVPPSPQRQWIARALPAAQAVKAKWGVPIAVTLAHGALASDWGRLAPQNDYFGLLAVAPRSESRELVPTPALAAPGRTGFDDLGDAADAFGAALHADARFARAFRVSEPGAFVGRMADSDAMREPRYARAMMAVIALNGLEVFDG